MPNPIGFYDSPGERRRREAFQRTRRSVLDIIEPRAREGLSRVIEEANQVPQLGGGPPGRMPFRPSAPGAPTATIPTPTLGGGVPGRTPFRTTLPGIPSDTSELPFVRRLRQLNEGINRRTGGAAQGLFEVPGVQAAREIGQRFGIPGLGGIPTGSEAREFAEERGPIGLLEEERRLTGKVTEPVGGFLGRTIAENVAGVPLGGPLRALGVPVPESPLAGPFETAGEVGFPEVALLSNLVPIPFIDPLVAKVGAKLLRGLPIIVRGGKRLINREGVAELRSRLTNLVSDPKFGREAKDALSRLVTEERGAVTPPGGGKGEIDDLFRNLAVNDENSRIARRFIAEEVHPAFIAKFGDAPVMSVKRQFPSGGELLIEIHTAGWRDRAGQIGLEFVEQTPTSTVWRVPSGGPRLGPGEAGRASEIDRLAKEVTQRRREIEEARGLPRKAKPVQLSEDSRLLRVDVEGVDLASAARGKPQGLYFTLDTGVPSPHADVGPATFRAIASPKNPLFAPEITVKHQRFRIFFRDEGTADAGVSALSELVEPREFQRLLKLSGQELVVEMSERFPAVNWARHLSDMGDSYDLLSAYGAQLARRRGFDAIIHQDRLFPDLSEFVALTDDAFREVPSVRGALDALPATRAAEASVEGVARAPPADFVERPGRNLLGPGAVEPTGAVPSGEAAQAPARSQRFPGMDPLPVDIEPVQGLTEQVLDRALLGEDIVGRELDRVSLPPQRQVEAASKRTPPQDRALLAGEVTDVRRPMRSFDEVMRDVGGLFQRDWWTNLMDVIGRAAGPGRGVRSAMIQSRLYAGIEGGRMRLAFREWVGRNKDVLGLVVSGKERGKAKSIVMTGDAPSELAQGIDHIVAYPEKYAPTPEQKAALDELDRMSRQMVRMEQAHGVDVDELLEGYISRVVIKNPIKNEPISSMRSHLGTRPWFTRQRAIPDLEQGFAAGYRYADGITSMEARFSLSAETIGNQVAVDTVKRTGQLPSEVVRQTVSGRLREAQDAFQVARKQALKTGDIGDRMAAEGAQAQLDQAKRAMRVEGIRVSQKRPLRFGRLVDPDVAQALDRYIEQVPEGWTDDFFRIYRTTLINADISSAGLQNWHTAFRNPVAWTEALGYGLQAIARDPYDWLVRNADFIDEAIRFQGARVPTEFLLREGGSVSQRLGLVPVIRESQRFFEWNVFIAQVERWKGVRRSLLGPDGEFDVKAALDMGATLRKQSGTMLMPGLTQRQLRALSKTWFAPQFTAALNSAFVEPPIALARGAVRGGRFTPAETEAIRSWISAFGGAAGLTVAGTLAMTGRLPNMTDPDKDGFWGIPIGGGFVFPFGPYQPLWVAMTRSARAAEALARGETPSKKDLQAVPRYMSNKISIPGRWVVRALEAMGLDVEAVRGAPFGRPEETLSTQRGLLEDVIPFPIGPEQAVRGILKGAPITALEVAGVRTTAETPFQERLRIREEVMRERNISGSFEELQRSDPIEAARINDDPRVKQAQEALEGQEPRTRQGEAFAFIDTLRDRQRVEQEQDDERLLSGAINGNEWRQKRSDREGRFFQSRQDLQEFAGIQFGDINADEGTVGAATDAYFEIDIGSFADLETDRIDWFAVDLAQDKALAPLSDKEREDFQRLILGHHDTELELRYRLEARRLRDELGDTPLYVGLKLEDHDRVREFLAAVKVQRERWLNRGQDVPLEAAIRSAGPQWGVPPGAVEWAVCIRSSGTACALQRRNPEYDQFIQDNREELELFYPDLITRRIREAVAR